ncbi:MAG: hypothetical protein ACYTHJ_19575 [Planctomycetota bacterium]|jgi:hypothetical protein
MNIRNTQMGVLAICALVLVAREGRAADLFLEPTVPLHSYQESAGSFGWAVSELADIDNDGATDLIASAPFSNFVKVFSGRTGELLHNFTGSAGENFGYAIADAGDTNLDGVPDIIVGAPALGAGKAYVFSGDTDGALLLTLNGEVVGDLFGSAVSSAGDVNGDMRADLLVGADANDAMGVNSGRAYVLSGLDGSLIHTLESESSGDRFGGGTASAGDLNNDGIPEHIIGAYNGGLGARGEAYVFDGADGSLIHELSVPEGVFGGCFGQFFVAGVGLVDEDDVPDMYVGDFCDSTNGGGTGRAYVFSGADGSIIHMFVGETAGEGIGPGRGAGDVDFDGRTDLLVGAWTSSAGAGLAGKLFVYSGATGEVLRTITSLSNNESLGFDAVGVGDVNEDGQIDFLASGANSNHVYLLLGSPPGDFDGDGDVDSTDLDSFSDCYTGPGGGDIGPDCANGDFDQNDTIDCVDFNAFVDAWTDEGVPAVPAVCDCNGNTINDVDDVAVGDLTDDDGNSVPDQCETQLPVAEAAGGRYLQITPLGEFSNTPVALELRSLGCFQVVMYATAAGGLSPIPEFLTPAQWGAVTIHGAFIAPDSTYTVAADEGAGADGSILVSTWAWGDVNDNGIANFEDIQFVVQGFQGNFDSVDPANVDLLPCEPNGIINFADIQAAVFGFQQMPFTNFCPEPCD